MTAPVTDSGPGEPDDGCKCWLPPEQWDTSYYGIPEPGSQMAYDPACPVHSEHLFNPRSGAWEYLGGTIDEDVRGLSQWVDNALIAKDAEARLWNRCAKVAEETGEVIQALVIATGGNPRKAGEKTLDDVRKELLDVAVAALGAVSHLDRNSAPITAQLAAHARAVANRAGLHDEVPF